MERFWTTVLIGDAAVGVALLAPPGVAAAAVRGLLGALRSAWGSAPRSVPAPRLAPAP